MTDLRPLYPICEGSDIYVERDGQRVKLSAMQANLILRAWAEAVGGAMVAKRNPDDCDDNQTGF